MAGHQSRGKNRAAILLSEAEAGRYNSIMRMDLGIVVLSAVVVVAGGCSGTSSRDAKSTTASTTAAAATAATAPEQLQGSAASSSDADVFTGTIIETMNAGGYTYAHLKNGTGDAWIAAPEFDAKMGEPISAALDMPMRDFQSRTLNRTFPLLYFVQEIGRNGQPLVGRSQGAPAALMKSHGAEGAAPAVERIEPPVGGMSIADLFAKKAELSGKTITVRGTVVKFNGGIMERNWFHIQDGSGSAASHDNDLTATSNAAVKVGDVVTVSGVLGTNRDFGAGYAYDAILERASITGH